MTRVVRIACLASFCLALFASVASAQRPTYGEGCFDFATSLVPTPGEEGRSVFLEGAITGENFEPGICVPLDAPGAPVDGKCFMFVKREPVGPGEFLRAHPGQTAFTECRSCTVDGKTGDFRLKITYPNPKNISFTKFTIQDATGELDGLRGQGTLDFSNGCYTLTYQFSPSW